MNENPSAGIFDKNFKYNEQSQACPPKLYAFMKQWRDDIASVATNVQILRCEIFLDGDGEEIGRLFTDHNGDCYEGRRNDKVYMSAMKKRFQTESFGMTTSESAANGDKPREH